MTNGHSQEGSSPSSGRAAVFLDRDGTIIEDGGYLGDPDQVRLTPDARLALARLRQKGYLLIVASNQSGVARGWFDEDSVKRVNARVSQALGGEAAPDAFYYCPYLDGEEAVVEAYRRDSGWRKPQPGMLLAAAREHRVDLSRSWMIGDAERDVEAGRRAGCRTILLAPRGAANTAADYVVESLAGAAGIIEALMDEQQQHRSQTPQAKREVVDLLDDIRRQLDLMQRRQRQGDFSFLRLVGTLAQLLAVVAAAWGVIAILAGSSVEATARIALACFLQLVCLTILLGDRS